MTTPLAEYFEFRWRPAAALPGQRVRSTAAAVLWQASACAVRLGLRGPSAARDGGS